MGMVCETGTNPFISLLRRQAVLVLAACLFVGLAAVWAAVQDLNTALFLTRLWGLDKRRRKNGT